MISRRNFLKMAGAGTAGLYFRDSSAPAVRAPSPGQTAVLSTPKVQAYRPLGKTGLQVSDVGCGAINLFNANVLRYAFDCGVNHFDTAEGYLNTNSEKMLGQALKDVRSKAIITSKYLLRTPADLNRSALIGRAEASLKRLQTDYLDIAMVHSADEPEKLDNEEVIAAYTQLKKDGKARFIGFSTHRPADLLKKGLAAGIWEVILFIYNHMEGPAVEPLVTEAGKKGVGLIAMKVFAGGLQGSLKPLVSEKQRYSQAAIRWTLGNPHISACIVTMSTFSHVDEYVAVSGTPLQRGDSPVLSHYRLEAGPHYCRVSCGQCLSACPKGVAVNEVLRYAMYFENYGMEKNAVDLYRQLDPARKPAACLSCVGPCEAACPHGLAVKAKLIRSHGLLAA
jgi:aryl-alcohol dehydrogenase-like predicted oxidoreductase